MARTRETRFGRQDLHASRLTLRKPASYTVGAYLEDNGSGSLKIFDSTGTATVTASGAGFLQTAASKTADYTVAAADNMKHLDNTGASGSVTFTLPAVASSAGMSLWVHHVADQAVVITAPSGTLVGTNNAGRTTYTSGTGGQRIGCNYYLYCNGAKWMLAVHLNGNTIGAFS